MADAAPAGKIAVFGAALEALGPIGLATIEGMKAATRYHIAPPVTRKANLSAAQARQAVRRYMRRHQPTAHRDGKT